MDLALCKCILRLDKHMFLEFWRPNPHVNVWSVWNNISLYVCVSLFQPCLKRKTKKKKKHLPLSLYCRSVFDWWLWPILGAGCHICNLITPSSLLLYVLLWNTRTHTDITAGLWLVFSCKVQSTSCRLQCEQLNSDICPSCMTEQVIFTVIP